MSDKPKRKAISKDEKIAALLLTLMRIDNWGHLVPAIDRERAKGMTAREIISAFECDHYPIPVTWGGTNHPTNLQFLPTAEHREKTNTRDAADHAKVRRNRKKTEEAIREARRGPLTGSWEKRDTTAAPTYMERPKYKRPMPGSKASGLKKHMSGKVTKR